jgi:signal transduction histidine kinase
MSVLFALLTRPRLIADVGLPSWPTVLIIAVLAAATVFGVLHVLRLRRARQMEQVRTQIASDLHDEIGSALTRLGVQSELIVATDDPARMKALAAEIGLGAREIITTMADVVWSIDARNDAMGDLLGRMRDFAADVLEGHATAVHFGEAGLDTSHRLAVGVRRNLYLIYKEALSNIVRHSGTCDVWIDVRQDAEGFLLSVRDDGQEAAGHPHLHGQGQRNMMMRAAQIGARLTINGTNGYSVEVRLPKL